MFLADIAASICVLGEFFRCGELIKLAYASKKYQDWPIILNLLNSVYNQFEKAILSGNKVINNTFFIETKWRRNLILIFNRILLRE